MADYSTIIDRPYDNYLERVDSSTTGDSASNSSSGSGTSSTNPGNAVTNNSGSTEVTDGTIENGSVETMPVKSDAGMADLWITNLIRSTNWKPKKVGFMIDGQSGYAEFTDVYVSGNIQALTGRIGGWIINSDSISGIGVTLSSRGNAYIAFGTFPPTSPTTGTGIIIDKTGLYGLNADTQNFKIDATTGAITSIAGTIGGWGITSSYLIAPGNAFLLDAANQKLEVGATAPITIDGANKHIHSDNYTSGAFGSGFYLDSNLLEVGNIACRGLFRTSVFQKDIVNVIAGSFVVSPNGDVLDADMTSSNTSTLTIKGTVTLALNDILRIKEVNGGTVDDEWMRVTDITSAPTYIVARDLSNNYSANLNPTWKKGAAVVDYGQSGDGGVYMTASDTNAPYLSIFDHSGSPWTDISTKLRLGNLNGFLGYSTDIYGIAIGETNKYLKYDTSGGLQIKGDITITNPEDINTGDLNNNAGWTSDAALDTFISDVYTGEISALQNQLDGVTLGWFYSGVPTFVDLPTSDWVTSDLTENNLVTNPNDWSLFAKNLGTIDSTTITNPFGVANATQWTLHNVSYDAYRILTTVIGTTYTLSMWVNLGTATNFITTLTDGSSWYAYSPQIVTTISGWHRISKTFVASATTTYVHIGGNAETIQQTNGTVFLYGLKLEANSSVTSAFDDHIGDVYYDLDTGFAYRFIFDVTYQWYNIPDTGSVAALAAAAAAQDTADHKRRVFTATPYTPYDVGDLWLTSLTDLNGDLKKCTNAKATGAYVSGDWLIATKYTDDTVANTAISNAATAQSAANTAQTTADNKIESFYQDTAPHSDYTNVSDNPTYNNMVGDMWYKTSTNVTYLYTKVANGGNFDYKFVTTTIPNSVFNIINGKNTIFTTTPTVPYYVGDMWLTSLTATMGDLKKCILGRTTGSYTASEWVVATKYTDDTVANSKVTTFLQGTIPISIAIGDIWINTNDMNKMYRAASIGATTIATGKWILVPVSTTTFAQDAIPTSLAINDTWYDTNDGNKLYKANSVGATTIATGQWVVVPTDFTNLTSIPITLVTPSGDGLYLSSDYMGFYQSSLWTTYIDNTGNLVLGDIIGGNNGISWNQSSGTLDIKGSITLLNTIPVGSVTGLAPIATSADFADITGVTKPANNADVTLSAVQGGLTVTGGGITLDAGGSLKGGATDFFSGPPGFFLGYSAGNYKFSIGDTAGDYMLWDGDHLKLKGSFDVGVGGLINNSVYTVATLPVSPQSLPVGGGYSAPSAYE